MDDNKETKIVRCAVCGEEIDVDSEGYVCFQGPMYYGNYLNQNVMMAGNKPSEVTYVCLCHMYKALDVFREQALDRIHKKMVAEQRRLDSYIPQRCNNVELPAFEETRRYD